MTTTLTAQHHHRTPWIASAAVAAVIAGAGIVGFAWNASNDSAAGNQAPTLRTPTAQDYGQYYYLHGAQPFGGLDGHVPPAPPVMGGSHVHPAPPPPEPPVTSGGRVQMGP
jgi:hypothetical protein